MPVDAVDAPTQMEGSALIVRYVLFRTSIALLFHCIQKKRKQNPRTRQSANSAQSIYFRRPAFASALGQPRDYRRMLPSERFGDFSKIPQL